MADGRDEERNNSMKISNSEWVILEVLWESSPMTITQLTAILKEKTGWSKHTIITLLKRMQEKGSVWYKQEGRTKQFFPNIIKEEAELEKSQTFVEKFFDGSASLLISTMLKQGKISEKEIDEICELLHLERKENCD